MPEPIRQMTGTERSCNNAAILRHISIVPRPDCHSEAIHNDQPSTGPQFARTRQEDAYEESIDSLMIKIRNIEDILPGLVDCSITRRHYEIESEILLHTLFKIAEDRRLPYESIISEMTGMDVSLCRHSTYNTIRKRINEQLQASSHKNTEVSKVMKSKDIIARSMQVSEQDNLRTARLNTLNIYNGVYPNYDVAQNHTSWLMTFVPRFQKEAVDAAKNMLQKGKKEMAQHPVLGCITPKDFAHIRRTNQIKLAQDAEGNFLTDNDYMGFINQVFKGLFPSDDVTIPNTGRNIPPTTQDTQQYIGKKADEEMHNTISISDYKQAGDFSDVTIIEERNNKSSKNPNFRIRLFLSTTDKVESDDTLDAFVKLYADEADRDRDYAVHNFMTQYMDLGIPARASKAKLENIVIRQVPAGPTVTAYTKKTAHHITNNGRKNSAYALILPFKNISTLAESITNSDDDIVSRLKDVNDYALEMHKKGKIRLHPRFSQQLFENHINDTHNRIPEHDPSDSYVIPVRCSDTKKETVIKRTDYETEFHTSVAEEDTLLGQAYQRLGIGDKMDTYINMWSSLVHGDLHSRNIIIDENGNTRFIDFEFVSLGMPQEDLTMYIGDRRFKLTMEDELEIVRDYAKKRNVKHVPHFEEAYHLMTFQTELRICKYLLDSPLTYDSPENFDESYSYHLGRAMRHAKESATLKDHVDDIRQAVDATFGKKKYLAKRSLETDL
ncbi:MAG: aminoglycoside phosphotransferase family protein [Candidatus Woesearchaeota archaeon]